MGGKDHNTKAEPGFVKRRNKIDGQWSARPIEMLESPAWRALSLSAHRVIDRISIELAHHGGTDNGQLPVTKQDFIDYGISHNQVAAAIREAEALGFIRVTEHGRAGNSEYRQPSKFFLTFANSKSSQNPTHDWRKIKTIEGAEALAAAAREAKSPTAVMSGRRSWAIRKTKTQYRKQVPGSVPEIGTEAPQSPVPEIGTTERGRKQVLLSISWVRGAYPRAQSTPQWHGYAKLPLELRMRALGLSTMPEGRRVAAN
jgi:hypothetical protein